MSAPATNTALSWQIRLEMPGDGAAVDALNADCFGPGRFAKSAYRLRGRGIGIALMQAGIDAARKGPWRGILLVGDEPYYAKVGFSRLPPGRVTFPGPVDQHRILGLSLKGGEMLTLSGQVRRARIDDPVCAAGAGVG